MKISIYIDKIKNKIINKNINYQINSKIANLQLNNI